MLSEQQEQQWIVAREAEIASHSKKINRACGNCTLCCKLVSIETGEITKPADTWCQHCVVGQGCSIYTERPTACRTWTCQWLIDHNFRDHWYPAKAKMVVQYLPFGGFGGLRDTVEILVDPTYPNRWREEPWGSEIRILSLVGLRAGRFLTVIVVNGNRRWLVLPNEDVEWGKGLLGGVLAKTGPDEWHFLRCENPERAIQKMKEFEEVCSKLTDEERVQMINYLHQSGVEAS